MTQTNTDYLLQITSSVPDRNFGVPAASDAAGKFDDHLTQAATFSGDDSSNRGSSQRTDTARHDRDDRPWNASPPKPINHDNASSTSPRTSAVAKEPSAEEANESKPSADDDQHDTDESDDTTVAEATVASQTAANTSTKSDPKPKPTKNSDAPGTAKAAAIGKKALTIDVERNAAGKADRQETKGSSSVDAAAQHAEAAVKLAADATGDPIASNEEVHEPQELVPDIKRPKAAKSEVAVAKSKQAAGASNNGDVCRDSSDVAGTEKTSTEAAQKAIASVEVSATPAVATATKSKSKGDDTSDDDTRTGSPGDARPGARNDASVTASKVDAAQLVGSVPAPPVAGANAASKGKDNEQATKPIGAKSEPVAAAFARMARNNSTGSNDSAAGANDLPQVDPSRFIGRVAKAFQTAQDRGGTLQLRLSPPELGALRIELIVKDGVMSASLQTENANARRLLLDHLPALRDRLAEQNIRVDRFDVDVRDDSGGQSGARGSQQQQFQRQPEQPAPRRQVQPQARTREVAAPERIASSPIVGDTGLNLIV